MLGEFSCLQLVLHRFPPQSGNQARGNRGEGRKSLILVELFTGREGEGGQSDRETDITTDGLTTRLLDLLWVAKNLTVQKHVG